MKCPNRNKGIFSSLPQMERGISKIIGGDPKGKNFIYTNGKSVIIRDIEHPDIADVYTEHAHQVLVAKYSPSGFYIASGDVSGKVRIWDTTQKEHILKYEYRPFAGKIKDICWTEDSKRIAVVGEGKEIFGSVFLWDSGSSVGEISGHSKIINSVDIKQTRPYRIATGSDDFTTVFLEGPPFKFKISNNHHGRFVNCVRFSPDGNRYASCGSDGQIFIYDGKTSEKICALGGDKAHNGGIYAISWSSDSTCLLSASGDKTTKIWDVGANSVVTTFNMGNDVLDQQLGCLWQGSHLLSISLSGFINYLDKANPSKPIRIIKGHTKSIQSLTVHTNDGKPYIYSGSHDGYINILFAVNNDGFLGKGHTNQVNAMAVNDSGDLVSCGMDDTLRFTNLCKKEYNAQDTVKLDVQPQSLAVGPSGYTVVVCMEQVVLLKEKKKVCQLENLNYKAQVVAIHPGGVTVAVGGEDGNIYMYSIQGNTLKENDGVKTLKAKGPVTAVAYSPDGAFLAVCDANKVITLFSVADEYKEENTYHGHHAKIVCIGWSPDNQHFATGGMDSLVYIWTLGITASKMKLTDAHRLYHISGIAWLDEHILVTTSHDACVKQWTITFK
uniref:WD repeat domain 1 n=1 Tax=Callorhinchus milii TaxID=7868 RepID=A0A4W3HTS5_CALMI